MLNGITQVSHAGAEFELLSQVVSPSQLWWGLLRLAGRREVVADWAKNVQPLILLMSHRYKHWMVLPVDSTSRSLLHLWHSWNLNLARRDCSLSKSWRLASRTTLLNCPKASFCSAFPSRSESTQWPTFHTDSEYTIPRISTVEFLYHGSAFFRASLHGLRYILSYINQLLIAVPSGVCTRHVWPCVTFLWPCVTAGWPWLPDLLYSIVGLGRVSQNHHTSDIPAGGFLWNPPL